MTVQWLFRTGAILDNLLTFILPKMCDNIHVFGAHWDVPLRKGRLIKKGKGKTMARKNRMSIPDAFYHVTTRIAHREMLLAGEAVKDRIMEIIYSTAIFSGVEVYAWCIMDNHLHILVHVPRVPGELWTEEGHEPDAYAFGMRPPECREPMWPSPSTGTVPRPRPAVGFMLDDEEFVERLAGIYGRERAERRVDGWRRLEEAGCAERAVADRERLCRRMYNISQFMKTLKERVTRIFNSPFGKAGHEGALWQGRFHSGVVEPTAAVLAIVAAYIEFNPVKAGIADAPGSWRWSSFSCALGDGPRSAVCRRMYERTARGRRRARGWRRSSRTGCRRTSTPRPCTPYASATPPGRMRRRTSRRLTARPRRTAWRAAAKRRPAMSAALRMRSRACAPRRRSM